MFNKILVVCVGNICRSPIGEALLKKYVTHCQIDSAGVKALVGSQADAQAQAVAASHNIDLSKHEAKQLTQQMCQEADLILVMEAGHTNVIDGICPMSRGKVMLFGQWLGGDKDIADPYQKSDEMFALVYQKVDDAAKHWAQKLG